MLKDASVDFFTLFKTNGMKANTDKCHLLVNTKENVCAKIGPCDIQISVLQNLVGVFIDNKLIFENF